jgi:hypothetical protein
MSIVWLSLLLSALSPPCRADIIVENTAGISSGGAPFVWGQSVTTPTTGGPWSNITFNFYNSADNSPYAAGSLFLLNVAYTGKPSALSSSTTGYIATATASGGIWTFDSSVMLQPNFQYFFYMNSLASGVRPFISSTGTDVYAGGKIYYTGGGVNSNFVSNSTSDMNFTLSYTDTNPGPIPGAGLLSYLLLGICCATAFGRRVRTQLTTSSWALKRLLASTDVRAPTWCALLTALLPPNVLLSCLSRGSSSKVQ